MTETPIIFLDFDGVIRVEGGNDGGWAMPSIDFQPDRMKMISRICEKTGAKIVISSDWRSDGFDKISRLISPYLSPHIHEDWATEIRGYRWAEIERWLSNHPEVTKYAILDDMAVHFDGCPKAMADRLVLCTNRFGFVLQLASRVMELIGPDES